VCGRAGLSAGVGSLVFRAFVGRLVLCQVGVCDGFVAVGTRPSGADALAVEVAVLAASFVEVATLAGGAFVHDDRLL